MNGELLELYNKLDTRLAVSDIEYKTWVKAHDTASNLKHTENVGRFNRIEKLLESIPYKKIEERVRWHSLSIKALWGVLIVGGLITFTIKYWTG